MTVTHRDKDGKVVWTKHWGPERLVEIYREPETSLGLSIVGGKVEYIKLHIFLILRISLIIQNVKKLNLNSFSKFCQPY